MKYPIPIIASLIITTMFSACIGDDFINDEVEPSIKISNPISQLQLDSSYQLEYAYFNNIGKKETIDDAIWSSSNEEKISITSEGLISGIEIGFSTIKIERADPLITTTDEIEIEVTEMPVDTPDIVKGGVIQSTSSYILKGTFEIRQIDDNLKIDFENDYEASTALPGLYVYLSNNPNTISNAYEIGAVEVFAGAHSYIVENININEYGYLLYFCKPFNVKVGDGQIN